MDQTERVRLSEGVARLSEQVHHTGWRHRPEPIHQRIEIDPPQELHHGVEVPVLGHAEVV